ncbi:MAG: hypothetical protein NVSMB66_2210 [Candidatus Doudnabacteria bacterium]
MSDQAKKVVAHILWIGAVLAAMLLPFKRLPAQGSIYPNPATPTFKPYGSLTAYGALSKDTLTPGGQAFVAFPVYGPLGSFASGRYQDQKLRVFGGGVYAPDDAVQIGIGYGREKVFRNDCMRTPYPTRQGTQPYNNCDASRGYGDYWGSNNLVMGYVHTRSKTAHFRAQIEYADYDSFDYYDLFTRDSHPREKFWYDAEVMQSIVGNEVSGVALGIQARRHQGVGPRLELNSQNFQIGAAAGWDFEQKFLKQPDQTYLDNRLKGSIFMSLRF